DRHAMVLEQQADLLDVVLAEEVRTRDRRLVHAGARDETVGETRIEPAMRMGRDPHERIDGSDACVEQLAVRVRLEAFAQKRGVALVDLGEPVDGGDGVAEALGEDRRRREGSSHGHRAHPSVASNIESAIPTTWFTGSTKAMPCPGALSSAARTISPRIAST